MLALLRRGGFAQEVCRQLEGDSEVLLKHKRYTLVQEGCW